MQTSKIPELNKKRANGAGEFFAPTENGNPRNSKGMAGKLFKPSRFYAERLAGKSRKNGACGAVKLWAILN